MRFDPEELNDRERLLRFLEGDLSHQEHVEVENWLKQDSRARALLAEMAEQGIAVADLARAECFTAKLEIVPKYAAFKQLSTPFWLGLAAALIAILAIGALLFPFGEHDSIARLEFVSPDAEFSPNHQLARSAGRTLGKGWVHLEEGKLRIHFKSGATVELEGPAAFGIDTPMRSYLDFGHARVHAPESARDFVVATDSMEVVDLGTRFELAVDYETRESNVSVSEGLVDLHLGSRGTTRVIRPLAAGFSARVDASGGIVEINRRDQHLADANPRLLAHWSFDTPTANGGIADVAGDQLDGMFSMGTPQQVPGVSGNALKFNRNAHVDLSEHAERFRQSESFTFTVWVRDPRNSLAMLFSLSGETERSRVQVHLFRKHVVYGWQDGLHYDAVSGRVDGWESGRWYHVAVACRDGVVRLYRDGELIASGSVGSKIGTPVRNPSSVKNATSVYLGKLEDGHQGEESFPQWFEGQMDDVQFYSGALDEGAIQYLYQHPGESVP